MAPDLKSDRVSLHAFCASIGMGLGGLGAGKTSVTAQCDKTAPSQLTEALRIPELS